MGAFWEKYHGTLLTVGSVIVGLIVQWATMQSRISYLEEKIDAIPSTYVRTDVEAVYHLLADERWRQLRQLLQTRGVMVRDVPHQEFEVQQSVPNQNAKSTNASVRELVQRMAPALSKKAAELPSDKK